MPDDGRRLIDEGMAAFEHAKEHVEVAAAVGRGADVERGIEFAD